MNALVQRLAIAAGVLALPLATLYPSSAVAQSFQPPPSTPVGLAPAAPSGATSVGILAGSTVLNVTVTLRPAKPSALTAYAQAVSTPGNATFRQYLTPAQFTAEFAPSASQVATVTAALQADGLQPAGVSANNLAIEVTATATQLAQAFGTGFSTYRLASGRVAYANSAAPSLPADVAPLVQGVIGLDNLALPQRLATDGPASPAGGQTAPHVVTGGPQPCSSAVSTGSAYGSYTADQLASAYQFSSLYGAGDLAAGQTVALYELEPNLTSDVAAFQSCYGTTATVSYVKVDGGAGSGAGQGEAALDIEDVISLAPQANVVVYQGPNSGSGAYDTYNSIISAGTAKVISTSWGLCESEEGSAAASSENTLFQEAAIQGQTIVAATGDNGSEDCGTNALAVDDPASQPYITGVGGTTLSTLAPPPGETVWNDRSVGAGAGGGGISTLWTMPSYQSGAPSSLNVINANSSATPCHGTGADCREVPDVSADADPYTGYVIYYHGSWTAIGGTSAAAPLWAAFTALTNASSSCAGKNVGFENPALYTAAANGYSADFQDVKSGNNDYTGTNSGKFTAGTGYDMASGLGTPDGASLPAALCSGGGTVGNTVTVTSPGNQTTTAGAAVTLQLSASDTATGQTLTFTATGLPAGLSVSTSGLVTGAATTTGTSSVIVTATDTTGAKGSASFTWTVTSSAPNTVMVTNPGNQSTTAGTAVSLQLHGTDSATGQTLTFTATGLPAGLSISTSGLVTGTPTTASASSVVVTANDTTGASGTASFTWTVSAVSCSGQLLVNPGFESGATGWTASNGVIQTNGAHSYAGRGYAWLDGYGTKWTDTVSQKVTIPAGCPATLTYELWISSNEARSPIDDTLKVTANGTTIQTLSQANKSSGYVLETVNVSAYAGQTVTFKWTGQENTKIAGTTSFFIDNTALTL